MKRTLLIDADIVAYKFASTNEEVWHFDGKDAPPATKADTENACKEAEEYVNEWADKLRCTDVIICLSDPKENWRKGLWADYKANRKGTRKPEPLMPVKDHLAKTFKSYARPTLEADDIMGVLATHPSIVPGEKIIFSEDKDMLGVPATVFNPRREKKTVVTEVAADRWHMTQALIGDPTDGYKGCPRIGPKSDFVTALTGCDKVSQMWAIVLQAFESKGLKEADALLQARLARICRHTDYDFEGRRPIPWEPPGA